MGLLVQFLLRLTFGLALGMAITSPRQVSSGYYRNHLYVTLGLGALASLLSRTVAPPTFWVCAAAAVVSYVGSVCWLYEQSKAGRAALVCVMALALIGAEQTLNLLQPENLDVNHYAVKLRYLAVVSSGLLLGMTMAAMLLGHWYLNSPTMELAPLRRLIIAMACAVALQLVVSLLGLWGETASVGTPGSRWWLFLVVRWTFGIIGVGTLAWMAWQTLRIPNTQSATGILYVAVIGTFVGETMSLLLSTESMFPL